MPRAASPALTSMAALSVLVISGALALCAAASAGVMALALVLGAAVLAAGWPDLLELPSQRGVQLIIVGAGLALALADLPGERERGLRWLPAVLAVALLASFLLQMVRQDGRDRLVPALGGIALALGLLGSGAFYLAALDERRGQQLLTACVLACAIGVIVDLALHDRGPLAEWGLPIAMFASAVAAALLGLGWHVPWGSMVLVAVGAAMVAHAVRRLLGFSVGAQAAAGQLAVGAASVLACGVVAYVVAWYFR